MTEYPRWVSRLKRLATELGKEVALHKTSDDVSPELHWLISYADFKLTKWSLLRKRF
ncbi:hypothetical protein [Legionella gresilensis]|uniref:hypothetical protein n=1 Tax=Legionella gresilensis TaxID=91823 RepID=UPI001F5F74BD|nr:hypothetical protein [Legionella gresilensis]